MKIKYLLLGLLTPLLFSSCFWYWQDFQTNWFVDKWKLNKNDSLKSNNLVFSFDYWLWEYCFSLNTWYIVWKNTSAYFYYCNDTVSLCNNSAWVSNSWWNRFPSLLDSTYVWYNKVWYKTNASQLTFTTNIDDTLINTFYSNNYICSSPYTWYNSEMHYGYFDKVLIWNTSFFNAYPDIEFELYYKPIWNSSSDCSSVESQLSSCQSSLSDCQSNGSHCDTLYWVCVENLSWCNSDKLSLQNYNDSLSSQLNECLANSDWTWELLSWDCLQNSLFWLDNENMLSLPITNNLFLPNGYWGYLTTWNVLWISSLEDHSKVYEFDSWAKETTVNSIAYIMLFLIATWLIMVLLRFLKRLFKL